MTSPLSQFANLAVALGLGLLVGLQREHVSAPLAGLRTFPIVTVLGFLAAHLASQFGGIVIAAGFLGLALLIGAGNYLAARSESIDPGITTEAALLLMYAVGALLAGGQRDIAIAIGAGTAVLLQFKGELRGIVDRLGSSDLKAIMQLALLSLVILPVLPDRGFGPYQVLNPRQIWWMVILVVAMNLTGYLAGKFLRIDNRKSSLLHGLLGGLVSSTATTATYSRRSRVQPASGEFAAFVILVASIVVFFRVLAVVGLLSATLLTPALRLLAPPVLVGAAVVAVQWWRNKSQDSVEAARGNPAELCGALLFAGVYAAVLLGAAAMKDHFGDAGLLAVAALAGLSDMDAITLSTIRMVNLGQLAAPAGAKAIGVAILSNLVFKTAIVASFGSRKILRSVVLLFAPVAAALVIGLALNWP